MDGEISPSALLCVFAERAVRDDREANGRFVPPTSRGKDSMIEGMLQLARDEAAASGRDFSKAEARIARQEARGDTAEYQLVTLMMSVAAWNLREDGLVELEPMESTAAEPVSSARPTRVFGASHAPTRTCRMTLTTWAARPSVEGLLLDTLRAGKPQGVAATWQSFGGGLGTEGSLRWAISITEIGRPDDPWKALRTLWEREAVDAGLMRLAGLPGFRRARAEPAAAERLAPAYAELRTRWQTFNAEERELADAIRNDAFLGITSHLPEKSQGTDA